jgi:tight adherence protein B
MDLLVAAAAAVTFVVCFFGFSLAHKRSEAVRILARLGPPEGRTKIKRLRERRALLAGFAERVRATQIGARLAEYVVRVHPQLEFSDAIAIAGAAVLGGFLAATLLFGGGPLVFVFAALSPVVADRILVRAGGRRAARIETQLPDALALQASALRAGKSTVRSLKILADETPDPLGEEIRLTVRDIDLGGALDQTLERFVSRVVSRDVELWITAMLVHRVTGGNLATILDSLAERLRERAHIRAEIRALTAQGRLSGLVVAVAPLAFFVLLSATSREQMQILYTTPTGIVLLIAGLGLIGAGFAWIRWLLRIRP